LEAAKAVQFSLAAEKIGWIWGRSSNTTSALVLDLRVMMRTTLHLILLVCFSKSIYDTVLSVIQYMHMWPIDCGSS